MGIYKLTCADCHKSYIGQTGHFLNVRNKEYTENRIKHREVRVGHAYFKKYTSIWENIRHMAGIDYYRKDHMMNIKENSQIYLHKQNNTLTEGQKTDENKHSNILFDIAIQHMDTVPQNKSHACA